MSGRPQVSADAMNEATRALAPSSLDGAPVFIGMCDAQFRPSYLNPAGRSLVCFPDTTALTHVGIHDFFVPAQRSLIDQVGLPAMAREGRWEHDMRFRDWQDPAREIDVRCSIFGLYDEARQFMAGVTITQRISERTRTERALRDGRALVDAVLERLPIGIGVFDAAGQLVHSNDGWRRLGVYSLPARAPTARERARSFGTRRLATPAVSGTRALRGERVSAEELFCPTDEAPPSWVRISAAPLPAGRDTPPGAVLVAQDIDEPRRTRERLARSEIALSVATEVAGVGIFSFEPSSGALEWDERSRQLWGLRRDATVDWPMFLESLHPEDAGRVRAALGHCMSAGKALQCTIRYRIIRQDTGAVRRIAMTLRAIYEGSTLTRLCGASIEATG